MAFCSLFLSALMHIPKHIRRPPLYVCCAFALLSVLLAIVFAVVAKIVSDSPRKLRVACVGDSTTWGTHATRAEGVTYPDYLAKLGRRTLEVRNFGVGATTLLRRSGRAWCDTGELERAIAFQPDVVVIMFGVNEISHPDLLGEFLPDALWLVGRFKNAIPGLDVFLATPTPLAPGEEKHRENTELRTKIMPDVRKVAQMAECQMIEVNHDYPPTLGFLPDGVHPNAQGNRLIAQLVFNAIQPKE
jgi:sialate O-acetylesterase